MNTSDREKRTTSASQRPTLEVVDDDSLEFSTLPPSEVPSEPGSDRSTIPGAARASWSVLTPDASLPVAFELRLLLGVLRALTPVHTNLLVPPDERVYGRVCRQNVRVDPDGTVRLCPRDEALEPSGELRAPEEFGQGTIDQQADLYAVGALVLAAVERGRSEGNTWVGSVHSIATRAVRLDRRARWASASEFAAQVEAAVGSQLPSQQALCLLLRSKSGAVTSASEVKDNVPNTELENVRGPTSVRPSIVSLADSDVQADESIDEETTVLGFEGARPATSTVPGGIPSPQRTPWPKSRWTGTAAVIFVGAASWGAYSLVTLRGPQSAEVRPSLRGEIASIQVESLTVSAPPTDSPAISASTGPDWETLDARPRPSATGTFPPAPTPNAKPVTAPRSGKPKARSPRPSTYDPEGI